MRRYKPLAEINVVPYIDVMLVLLVIFMITAPLLTQGVAVALPEADGKALAPQEQEPLIVTVDKEGKYYLNTAAKPHEALSAQHLRHLVAAEFALARQGHRAPRQVMVKGDKQAQYGQVASVPSSIAPA